MATTTITTQIPNLPPRLLNFFAKYPPHKFSAFATGLKIPTIKQREALPDRKPLSARTVPLGSSLPEIRPEINTLQSISDVSSSLEAESSSRTETTSQNPQSTTAPSSALPSKPKPNPFLPTKNHTTGKWTSARYGLRIQADLFKLARQYGVEELLPPSIKSSDYKQRRVLERGLAVRGTGEGQSVKGHKWERQMGATLEKRRKAMEEMPEMIRLWKQQGHGRGWKKFPK